MGSREPFRQFALEYHARGWIPLPLPPREKSPPPLSTTGHHPDPTLEQIEEWILSEPEGANIGLRVPDGIIGVDVDAYGGKKGGEGLVLLREKYGEDLPPTWTLTARADGISGIRFYRVPTGLQWPGELAPDVQIVQHRHRYAVAAPSMHPKTKRTYKWYPPGAELDGRSWTQEIPDISGLAALSEEEVG
jgi:hypothetical protein